MSGAVGKAVTSTQTIPHAGPSGTRRLNPESILSPSTTPVKKTADESPTMSEIMRHGPGETARKFTPLGHS